MKPRIFVSAVTRELRSARQLVANTLIALGYEPVWQDIFDLRGEDLRVMLRDKIDGCSAVLQIVGEAYGAEPPQPDEQFGRVSYTQYEARYAKSQGKKVYYLVAEPQLPRDEAAASIEVPLDGTEAAHADAAERLRLQRAYAQSVAAAEHVYYPVQSHAETELSVRRLRDELDRLRRGFRQWMIGVAAALVFIVSGLTWLLRGQERQQQQANATRELVEEIHELELKPELIRERLVAMIEQTYQTARKESETLADWKRRDDAREAAKTERERALGRVDEFLGSILRTVRSGDASPEYLELTRILQEQGQDQALAYIASREEGLLAKSDRLAKQQQSELRRELAPLLEAAQLEANQGRYAEALARCEKVLAVAPGWPEAIHQQFSNLKNLGDRALHYDTTKAAGVLFRRAHEVAKELSKLPHTHVEAQRDMSVSLERLGYVTRRLGDMPLALKFQEGGLEISRKLAAADPTNVRIQRDLAFSLAMRAELAQKQKDSAAARKFCEEGLEIRRKIATTDPTNPEAQRDLAFAFHNLSIVTRNLMDLSASRKFCEDGLEIRRKLAIADPTNAELQRDLSMSFWVLGDVTRDQGDLPEARNFYEQGLAIREKIASADPANGADQAYLASLLTSVGGVAVLQGDVAAARELYEQGLQIREKLAASDPTNAEVQLDRSNSLRKMGDVTRQQGDLSAAQKFYAKYAETIGKLAATIPHNSKVQRDLWVSLTLLGHAHRLADDKAAAISRFLEAAEVADRNLAGNPDFLNRYDFACYRTLELLRFSLERPNPNSADWAQRSELQKNALEAIRSLLKAGYANLQTLRNDPDFSALQGLPEFEALLVVGNLANEAERNTATTKRPPTRVEPD